jgi:AraC-like DNA-binding protein
MDSRAQQAREHHRKAQDVSRIAEQHRAQRDDLVRELWATQRGSWTYAKLAAAVGCSPELIAKIINLRS